MLCILTNNRTGCMDVRALISQLRLYREASNYIFVNIKFTSAPSALRSPIRTFPPVWYTSDAMTLKPSVLVFTMLPVWHSALLSKLPSYGINEQLCLWFPNYLKNRNNPQHQCRSASRCCACTNPLSAFLSMIYSQS